MAQVMITARFLPNAYFGLTTAEVDDAKAKAKNLFGSPAENIPRTNLINFIYTATYAGESGWVLITDTASMNNIGQFLVGPITKIFELEIFEVNRALGEDQGDTNIFDTMAPLGSWKHVPPP